MKSSESEETRAAGSVPALGQGVDHIGNSGFVRYHVKNVLLQNNYIPLFISDQDLQIQSYHIFLERFV